jgi:hypothetical protein
LNLGRVVLLAFVLIAGAVLPYLLSDDAWMAHTRGLLTSLRSRVGGSGAVDPSERAGAWWDESWPTAGHGVQEARSASGPVPQTPAAGRPVRLPAVNGPPGATLEQLLNFAVTKEWISANWARVSTRLAEIDLEGRRVPVALGDGSSGLVGSLTYYFDQFDHVQRISLHGYLENPDHLLRLASGRFQMQPYPSLSGDVYLALVDRQPLGLLSVTPAPVVHAHQPGRRFEVLLELNRTQTRFGLSGEARQIVARAVPPAMPETTGRSD